MKHVKQIIITLEDYEDEPFTDADIENIKSNAADWLDDYNVDVQSVEIRNVNET